MSIFSLLKSDERPDGRAGPLSVASGRRETAGAVATPAVAEGFRGFFRHQVSTAAIVTAADGSVAAAVTATSLCALMESPPSLIASLERQSSVGQMIVKTRRFGVMLLHETQQGIARAFMREAVRPIDADQTFRDGRVWMAGPSGIPLLADCLSRTVCDVFQSYAFGTHIVFVATMHDIKSSAGQMPLLHATGRFGRLSL